MLCVAHTSAHSPRTFLDSAEEKLSEAPRLFDLAKDRFHNALPRCVYFSSRLRPEFARHFVHSRGSLGKWSPFAALRLMSVFLSACRYINIHRLFLQILQIPFRAVTAVGQQLFGYLSQIDVQRLQPSE